MTAHPEYLHIRVHRIPREALDRIVRAGARAEFISILGVLGGVAAFAAYFVAIFTTKGSRLSPPTNEPRASIV